MWADLISEAFHAATIPQPVLNSERKDGDFCLVKVIETDFHIKVLVQFPTFSSHLPSSKVMHSSHNYSPPLFNSYSGAEL